MAGINLSSVVLNDRWPGIPNSAIGIPANGWDNTDDCFKTTAAGQQPRYPLGTKVMAYTDNSWCPGWYTMIYLMYHSFEAVTLYECSADFSNTLPVCGPIGNGPCLSQCEAYFSDTSTAPYYVVSRCVSGQTGAAFVDFTRAWLSSAYAIPCWTASSDGSVCFSAASRTGSYGDSYGWFWCGGVCPAKEATLFDGKNAGLGSACAGIGACCSGTFATKAQGPLYYCVSQTTSTQLLTNDISEIWKLAGDVSEAAFAMQPLGWSCMTAI